jgi:uncharacterized damage-inducible protein DinB
VVNLYQHQKTMTMNIIEALLKELTAESDTTRKMLERIPNEDHDWQPHPKSMTVRRLGTHIADLGNWIGMTVNSPGLDFATGEWKEEEVNDTAALLDYFERSLADGIAQLTKTTEGQLDETWTLRNGDHVIMVCTKYEMIRIVFAQMIHHRAQMGVYLRLLNIPIPGSYGPSADELEEMQKYQVA